MLAETSSPLTASTAIHSQRNGWLSRILKKEAEPAGICRHLRILHDGESFVSPDGFSLPGILQSGKWENTGHVAAKAEKHRRSRPTAEPFFLTLPEDIERSYHSPIVGMAILDWEV